LGDEQILLTISFPFPLIRAYRRTPRVAIKHHIVNLTVFTRALNEANYA
jgi:hypothetical protein